MNDVFVETIGLKKYFKVKSGYLHAVDNINFTIPKGKTLGVVGESGCGKTTLGRVVLRLIEPTDGKIFVDGVDITAFKPAEMLQLRKELQIIFQDPYSSINPRMTVSEIIEEPMKVLNIYPTKKEAQQNVFRLMEIVGLDGRLVNTYPHELDGGRRQRIGIARALAVNPKFIICDEPVSSLDVSIQAQILNLLMDLQDEMGFTYMFITHDLSVVRHISHEIMVMYLGQCVERAESKELFKNPFHPYTKALLNSIPVPAINHFERDREIIVGELYSPINPEPGCRFAARCPHRMEKCVHQNPQTTLQAPNHSVACFLYE